MFLNGVFNILFLD